MIQNNPTLKSFFDKSLTVLAQGTNNIKFDGKYSGENGGRIKIEIRAKGIAETLK